MATYCTYPGEIVSTGSDTCPSRKEKNVEANSQQFKAGELVVLDTSGDVTAVADDAVLIMGFAEAAGNNTTTANAAIPISVIKPGYEVKLPVINGSTACTTENFVMGGKYGLNVTVGTASYVDIAKKTAATAPATFLGHCQKPNGDYTIYGIFCIEELACQSSKGTDVS